MEMHFPKLRRLLHVSASAGSLIIFTAFLVFAAGHLSLMSAAGIWLLGMFVMLPAQAFAGAKDRELAKNTLNWPKQIAFILFLFWLIEIPEVRKLIDRVSDSDGVFDWRLILAVAIWTTYSGFTVWRAISQLSDEAIYRFISSNQSDQTKKVGPDQPPTRPEFE